MGPRDLDDLDYADIADLVDAFNWAQGRGQTQRGSIDDLLQRLERKRDG